MAIKNICLVVTRLDGGAGKAMHNLGSDLEAPGF